MLGHGEDHAITPRHIWTNCGNVCWLLELVSATLEIFDSIGIELYGRKTRRINTRRRLA